MVGGGGSGLGREENEEEEEEEVEGRFGGGRPTILRIGTFKKQKDG